VAVVLYDFATFLNKYHQLVFLCQGFITTEKMILFIMLLICIPVTADNGHRNVDLTFFNNVYSHLQRKHVTSIYAYSENE